MFLAAFTSPLLAAATPPAHAAARVWMTIGTYEIRTDDLWIIATAICCAVACGLVGCFLVLRRMSLLGDAISHAILPGLAIAFLLTGSRDPLAMLAGALVVGVLTAFLSTGLHKLGRVPEDAAMGVVFTTLFAIGVILVTVAARNIDLDPGCVLYGLIETTPFDTVSFLGLTLPRAFVWLAVVLLVNAGLITLFYKELKIVCFDPYLATTMGISAVAVHYGLMTAVAATAVASFESVGSILVVAMLVAPGATAQLLTDRLRSMLLVAALVAALSAIVGYIFALIFDTSVAGMIASAALVIFIAAALLAPRHGFFPRRTRQLRLSLRIVQEDILGLLFRWHEQVSAMPTTSAVPLSRADLLRATRAGWLGTVAIALLTTQRHVLKVAGGGLVLSPDGQQTAAAVIRGHRLWESFLARHFGVAESRLHAMANRAEHYLGSGLQERLGKSLHAESGPDASVQDPHGRSIPPSSPPSQPPSR